MIQQKSCSSNSEIHGKGDIEQEIEEDNEEIAHITDVTVFDESEKTSLIRSFLSKFNRKWSISKKRAS